MMEDIARIEPEWSRGRRETVKTFLEGVSLTDANVLIGWIGQAIEEEELWGCLCFCNDVHWENGGACGSPAVF